MTHFKLLSRIAPSLLWKQPAIQRVATRRTFISSAFPKQQYRRFNEPSLRLPMGQGSSSRAGNKRIPPMLYVVAGGGGVYYVYHLEKVPETGRWRFIDVSTTTEREMGDEAAKQVLAEYRGRILPARDPRVVQVHRVVHRILEASGLDPEHHKSSGVEELDKWGSKGKMEGVDWQVYVIDDPTINAFVLPNGSIFVFTGLLPVAANEDGLAAVLGHEVAHQVARHSGERMSGQKVAGFAQLVLATLGLDIGLASAATQYLLTLPNSRTNETEADSIGLSLASSACYDPREAVHLWERMAKAQAAKGGGAPPQFLSTHPSDSTRIDKIRRWLPEVLEKRSDRCGPYNDFDQAVKKM